MLDDYLCLFVCFYLRVHTPLFTHDTDIIGSWIGLFGPKLFQVGVKTDFGVVLMEKSYWCLVVLYPLYLRRFVSLRLAIWSGSSSTFKIPTFPKIPAVFWPRQSTCGGGSSKSIDRSKKPLVKRKSSHLTISAAWAASAQHRLLFTVWEYRNTTLKNRETS